MDEVEKYLFYRGVGNANFMDGASGGHYVLQTVFHKDTLVITNQTEYGIGYALVFERAVDPQNSMDSINTIWWSGSIKPSGKVKCLRPVSGESTSWDQALIDLRDNLVAAGLYKKEADAMVQTWKQSYFGTMGLRVFWIVPRISTDQSLPMKVSPQPDDIQRVLVARSEVLTPEFEKQLLQNGTDSYYSDRYYLAYQARSTALTTAGVTSSLRTTAGISVYPNPSNASFTFTSTEQGTAQIMIVNLLGQAVAHLSTNDSKNSTHSFTWDAQGMPAGMYTCVVQRNGSVEQVPIMLVR